MTERAVLITGFPGEVARQVVERCLVAPPGVRLRVLVEPAQRESSERALARLGKSSNSVDLVEGSLQAIDFGLSGAAYRALAQTTTAVLHLMRDREHVRSWEPVEAMREIIELSRASATIKHVVYLSSTSVSGTFPGLFRERDLDVRQSFHDDGERKLATAERMAQRYINAPLTVLRPCQMVGDSRNGRIDRLDGPYPFIVLMLTSPPDLKVPLVTRGDQPFYVVPIDIVARVVAAMLHAEAVPRRTLHLVETHPPTVRRAFELVAAELGRGLNERHIPGNLATTVLRTPGVDKLSQGQAGFWRRVRAGTRYGNEQAVETLSTSDIEVPRFEDYVPQLVEYVRRRAQTRRMFTGDAEARDLLD